MFIKQIAVVGAVLVLGSYLAASDDALAVGLGKHGQRPSYKVKNGALNLAGSQNRPPSKYFSPTSSFKTHNGNTDFSASGPYVGLKYIGNQ